jgi:hypothetical protein
MPTNIEKSKEFSCFETAGCSSLRAEGFSCSLCVLYGGLGITKLQFFSKKYPIFFSCKLFSIFYHQNPGFRTGSRSRSAIRKNALNQCGPTRIFEFGYRKSGKKFRVKA